MGIQPIFDVVIVDETQHPASDHERGWLALVESKLRRNRPQNAGQSGGSFVTGSTCASYQRRSNGVRCAPVSTVTENADRAERIGRKIAKARKAKGLSKYMLAKLAGVREGQIRHWERGDNACGAPNLLKLIPHIGGTLDFYLGDVPPDPDDDDDDAA
jgi:DNA-binding XRE family transcriptional regulator